jgi:N-acylneuraminate cytidylyltransferase
MQKIIAIITVRKGSSLRDKNIRIYKGKPLLVNCIEKLKGIFDRVIVLSDSTDYGQLASNHGAEVFIDETVGDLDDVTVRLRNFCNAIDYNGRVVLCQCTSPNIYIESYRKAYEISVDIEDDEVLMSCVKMPQKPSAFYLLDEDGYLESAVNGMPIVSKPRQTLPHKHLIYYNGGITSFHTNQLSQDSLFENARLKPLFISEEEILDIDEEDDLKK